VQLLEEDAVVALLAPGRVPAKREPADAGGREGLGELDHQGTPTGTQAVVQRVDEAFLPRTRGKLAA